MGRTLLGVRGSDWYRVITTLPLEPEARTHTPEYTIHRIDVCHATHLWTVPNSNSVYYTGRMKKFSLQDRSRKIASMEKIVQNVYGLLVAHWGFDMVLLYCPSSP